MTERKWTPGPWLRMGRTVYALNDGGTNRFCLQVQGGFTLQSRLNNIRTSDHELEAVAICAAAAPELYEALEQIAEWLSDPRLSQWHYVESGLLHEDAGKLEATALAALAKARGET